MAKIQIQSLICFKILTIGIKENRLYFWLRITFGGNFWVDDSRPIQIVLEDNSFSRQQKQFFHIFEQKLEI